MLELRRSNHTNSLEEWLFKLISRFLEVNKGIDYANCIGFLFSNYLRKNDPKQYISDVFESPQDNLNFAVGGILLTEGISKVFSTTVIEVEDDENKTYIGDDSYTKLSHDLIDSIKKPYGVLFYNSAQCQHKFQ